MSLGGLKTCLAILECMDFFLSVCFVNVLGCWYLSNISLKWPWFTGKCSSNIWFSYFKVLFWGFPGGSDGKASACNVGDLGSVPGLGRSPGEGKGYPLQYSALENSMDREDLQAVVHGVTKGCIQLDWVTLTPQGVSSLWGTVTSLWRIMFVLYFMKILRG